MPVAFTNLTSGTAVTVASQATASITLTANRLGLLTVVQFSSATTATTPTCSGWTQVATVLFEDAAGLRKRVTVLRRLAGTDLTGTHTIDFTAQTQDEIRWSVDQSDAAVDTTGTNGSGAIVQAPPALGVSTAPLVTLAAFGHADNGTFGALGIGYGPGAITDGSGFTRLVALGGGGFDDTSLLTEYKIVNDTTVDATLTASTTWGIIGIEVKAAQAGGGAAISPMYYSRKVFFPV